MKDNNISVDAILEEWQPVKGFESFYEVSSHGNVRSLPRMTKSRHGTKLSPGRHLKLNRSSGYQRVHLHALGKKVQVSVHRLVAQTFIPNPDNKPCVNHKNGIKTYNQVSNLEWATHKQNTQHALINGMLKWKAGKDHPNSKRTHCPQGHPYSGDNLYFKKSTGYRVCRACTIRHNTNFRNKKRRLFNLENGGAEE